MWQHGDNFWAFLFVTSILLNISLRVNVNILAVCLRYLHRLIFFVCMQQVEFFKISWLSQVAPPWGYGGTAVFWGCGFSLTAVGATWDTYCVLKNFVNRKITNMHDRHTRPDKETSISWWTDKFDVESIINNVHNLSNIIFSAFLWTVWFSTSITTTVSLFLFFDVLLTRTCCCWGWGWLLIITQ